MWEGTWGSQDPEREGLTGPSGPALPSSRRVATLRIWLKLYHMEGTPAPVTTCVCCPECSELTRALSSALSWVLGAQRGRCWPGFHGDRYRQGASRVRRATERKPSEL